MKLRIRGNSLRLRLTQGDVARLGSEGEVSEAVEFGGGNQSFIYTLAATEGVEGPTAAFANGNLTVSIPKKVADEWTSTDMVGIESAESVPSILIEKDFACLSTREGEDESDTFPNPEASMCYNRDTVS